MAQQMTRGKKALRLAGFGGSGLTLSPAALRALKAIGKANKDGWTLGGVALQPGERELRDGINRTIGQSRRSERVTYPEILRVWTQMGFSAVKKQEEIARDMHMVRHARAGRRSGKALALDTLIPTLSGRTTMGAVKEGDTLFDEKGKPCTVTFVSEIFTDHDCYNIRFSDGSNIVADAGHQWQVETKKVRKSGKPEMDYRHDPNGRPTMRKKHEAPILTTEEMFQHGVMANAKELEYAIPLTGPIECPEDILPVDAYLLGCWLGDGTSTSGTIWINDPDIEIIEEIRRRGYDVAKRPVKYGWQVYGIQSTLRELGVLGKRKKRIPARYLRASFQQRLDLLCGLVDTDGHISPKNGDVEITTVLAELSLDIKELAESLGCKVTVRVGRATLNGRDCGPKYRVAFSPTLPVARLKRKAQYLKAEHQWQKRYITAIDPVPSVPTRCIQVDSPSHLFLAGNFIPTHNTSLAAALAVAQMVARPGTFGWTVGPDYDLAFRCWTMIIAHLDRLAALGVVKYRTRQNTKSSMRVELDNGSVCEGQTVEDADGLQGVGLDFVIVDEIAQIQSFVFTEMLAPAFTQKNGWAFLIGTPRGDDWASRMARHDHVQAQREGREPDWAEFVYETWHNTVEFPGGRGDPKIMKMERLMPYEEFMEQVCARPQRSKYVTYKEFDAQVHVRRVPFKPGVPVHLSIDPSSGVNPYGVAVFQDYGDSVNMIDEYYKTSVLAEDVVSELAERTWWSHVKSAIVDDAWPQEVKMWQRLVWERGKGETRFMIGAAHKSQYIEDSIPLVKQWLRDPLRWNTSLAPIRAKVIEELFPGKAWLELEPEDQNQVMIHTENEADQDKSLLLGAARFFVDVHCRNVVDEFASYVHKKPKKDDHNVPEAPVKFNDHLMDCIRYFLWNSKRYYGVGATRATPVSYVEVA